jgi:hypothetical protein
MSQETAAAVCRALGAYAASGRIERRFEQRLREAARMLCADARARGMRAEQMLVALKGEWGALADVRVLRYETTRADVTSRFITLCIDEFYADSTRGDAEAAETQRHA